MIYSLYPCSDEGSGPCYQAEIRFELSREMLEIGGHLVLKSEEILKPIRISWGTAYLEKKYHPVRNPGDNPEFDPKATFLTRAQMVKHLVFPETLAREKKTLGKAIEAFLGALPDNWPVVITYG